ncbi:hypothetical protein CMO89_02685 [Candidatus Woesearchaeota archaeon]|nr:hypothetical protein [Candidatus Woesearchaeota archaeon]|tara:strand:+ start:9005 stop:9886 length:882 start_codon:yes stop_codon:yes gene_type:complete
MQSWILFTVLATLLWSVVSIIDKFVVEKWVKKPAFIVIVICIVGLLAGLLVYLFKGFSHLSYFNIALAMVTGVLYVLSLLLYFEAVKTEEISRIVPLWYLSPIFVSILASVFLGEIFTPVKYLGIFILVAGAMLISFKNIIKLSLGKPFWFMVLASLMVAVSYVITKHLLNFADYWTVFSYSRIGAFLAVIPIFLKLSRVILSSHYGNKVIGIISLNAVIGLTGMLLVTIAASIGHVSLVNALSSIQPFFVLLLTLFLSLFFPHIIKEEITKSTISLKLIAIALMFLGVILIT